MRILVQPSPAPKDRVVIRPRLLVERARLTYLEERGWQKNCNAYRGCYMTPHGSWTGEIRVRDDHTDFYIFRPPRQLQKSPHWSCFAHAGNDWWLIHFRRESPNSSDGIMAIERVINEAFSIR